MKIGIVGAGVVGTTIALELTRRGHQVTLLDRAGIAAGASRGNAGAFAFADVIPLATPGIMAKAPKWMLDPLGPLSIPPAYAAKISPWLWQFYRASRKSRYEGAVAAQGALMTRSREALDRLVAAEGLEPYLRREGQLQLYDTATSYRASLPSWEERKSAGVRFELFTRREEIDEIQPGLDPRFTHAGWTPDWVNVTDPEVWTRTLAERAQAQGATYRTAEVFAIRPGEAGVTLDLEEGPEVFDHVILAAGAHSRQLSKMLGCDVPLDTERGYNTTLPAGAFDLKTHVTFADHGFVVTKIGEGLRVGGGVELGGLKLPPNMARARALLNKAARFLPGLRTEGGTEWMGFRPSMPDSLPVIGPVPADGRVTLAFGHGHLGLTQSAGTAELVADLAERRATGLDMSPYAPTRF